MSLKRNVIANYLGQGWRALMGLAFIPLYIKYLGVEAYGLIGIFAVIQAWLALLDMGMKPALGREMARFTAGAHSAQSIRDLLRSIEIIGVAIAGAIALVIWTASGWVATDWVTAEKLPVEVVAQAFAVMGAVCALRFIESIYVSSVVGLQRQVLENVASSIMATVRGLGAVGVLLWISPTIGAFFIWQGLISLVTVTVFAFAVYRILTDCPRAARFSWPALVGIWRFGAGLMTITFLTLLLTQIDKILLSRLLTLEAFAYYALAGVVANALYLLAGPITTAFYPRFTELATRGDEIALRAAYHQAAQTVTVLMGSAAIVLMLFGERLLLLWTADPTLSQQVSPLLTILALGTLFNGLMWIPYHMQLAHGWTTLTIRTNIIAVVILVPTILWVVPKYGAIGAAWVWVTLNAGYLLFSIYFMHQRILVSEQWRWYRQDVFIPLVAASATAGLFHWLYPVKLTWIGEMSVLLVVGLLTGMTAASFAPIVRSQLTKYMPNRLTSA